MAQESSEQRKMEEVLGKLDELTADLEAPPLQDTEQGGEAPSGGSGDETPVLGKEAFDELEKQATETSNLMATNQGILESILTEVQTLHESIKSLLG